MHIAIFLPSLSGGGAEKAMLKLSSGFADQGHQVDFVLARAKGPYLSQVSDQVHLVDLNQRRDIYCVLPLARYIQKKQPDILLTGLHTNIIAIISKALTRTKTRIAISERNTFSIRSDQYSADLRMRIMPHLVRFFYPKADYITAVSKGVAADLSKVLDHSQQNIHVIYNPIVTEELIRKAEQPLDHPWFSVGEPPVVLGVGRLSIQKDFETLIKAFDLTRRKHPCRLLILGEGEERENLENLIAALRLQNEVDLPGFVSNPYPFMKRAAVFVLSSRWEGLPGVLIEALYCGSPLVSTNCPSGPDEILEKGKYGQLVPVGDVQALSNAIEMVLTNPGASPSPESWMPFEINHVLGQYNELFFGKKKQSRKE